MSFISDCIKDLTNIELIDDYVDRWHNGEGGELSLSKFLGMTQYEYSMWLKDATSIYSIIQNRIRGQ